MKRLHVHLHVKNLTESLAFYNALFAEAPTILKTDYAKWMLDDPRINFAISEQSENIGIEHLGIQVDSQAEFTGLKDRLLPTVKGSLITEDQVTCCYAQSNKFWVSDPQDLEWETFYTFGASATYAHEQTANPSICCLN